MKKYIAEALGTFALTLVVGLAISGFVDFPVATPILAALTLGIFVYTLGHVSGTHINPAVTIGAWSIKKISTNDAMIYILFQVIGGAAAFLVLSGTLGIPRAIGENSWMVALSEALGTFFFTFGIASVIYEKVPSVMSGIIIGGSLLLGITVAGTMGSNAILNPALAFGVGSFSLTYLLAPIVGSVLGMQAYKYLGR